MLPDRPALDLPPHGAHDPGFRVRVGFRVGFGGFGIWSTILDCFFLGVVPQRNHYDPKSQTLNPKPL